MVDIGQAKIVIYFNSRLRRETNNNINCKYQMYNYFNSRLRKETNVNSSGDVDFGWIFQLTSP